MIKKLQHFFDQKIQSIGGGQAENLPERALQLATACLLIEVSRADFHIDAKEKQAIAAEFRIFFRCLPRKHGKLSSWPRARSTTLHVCSSLPVW